MIHAVCFRVFRAKSVQLVLGSNFIHERTTNQGEKWKDKEFRLWVDPDFFCLGENSTYAATTCFTRCIWT